MAKIHSDGVSGMTMSITSWLQTWDTAIGAIGSIVLTFMLVILYAKQQGLLKRELNREVRQNHTETLKKRIREWHGDMDEIGLSTDPAKQFENSSNLPFVKMASVEPAPTVISVVGYEDDFRVIPETIEDDRYLQDLLENHAPDLRELKQSIEGLHSEFELAQESFLSEFPEGKTIDRDGYTLTPVEYYAEWVFERAVRLHRTLYETSKERERDIAQSRILGTNLGDSEEGALWYSPVSDGGPGTYKAEFDSGNLGQIDEYEDDIENELVEIHNEAIDDVDEEGIYEHSIEAARILDEMEKKIEELRRKLVEHEGNPLYTEDCPYLEEAIL